MSDAAPPPIAASSGEVGGEALSADAIDAIVADFRAWLEEARQATPVESAPDLDVATVLQHFTALRHEVNLQTKASRAQLEQNAQAIELLEETLGTLKRAQGAGEEEDEIVRPLLKTLIDAHDALALAEREVRRLHSSPAPAGGDWPGMRGTPPVIKLKIPHWARWLGLDASVEAQLAPLHAWAKTADPSAERYRQSLDALLTGYRMSLQRIERALEQQGLERIDCVGRAFDPETMEVAEVVRDPNRSATEVIDELRCGYRRHGRLFRYAQVRVARP